MASDITPGNIDGTYPIAGVDNDTQGFRTNFTNTTTNFTFAKAEIEDLQSKSILKAPLDGESVTTNTLTVPLNTAASDATLAGLNIAEGVAPTSPVDGDVWVTAAGAFNARLNGATVDLATVPVTINTQAGTTYIPVLADAANWIEMTNGAANTITIPANVGTAFPIGTALNFEQAGAGATTIAITTDTLNVNANLTLVLNGQYASATALKKTATTWVLFGNLVAV